MKGPTRCGQKNGQSGTILRRPLGMAGREAGGWFAGGAYARVSRPVGTILPRLAKPKTAEQYAHVFVMICRALILHGRKKLADLLAAGRKKIYRPTFATAGGPRSGGDTHWPAGLCGPPRGVLFLFVGAGELVC